MGFPAGCSVIAELPKSVLLVLRLLEEIRLRLLNMVHLTVLLMVGSLGLFRSLGDQSTSLLSTVGSPSIDPPFPSSLKNRLRVVEYKSFLKGKEPTCMVCLEELGERDEVRELGNCSHVFHRGCIDKWIDMCQVTCPLCRSQLLPVEKRIKGRCLRKLLSKTWFSFLH